MSIHVKERALIKIKDKQNTLLFQHAAECSDPEIRRADQLCEACLAVSALMRFKLFIWCFLATLFLLNGKKASFK